MLALRSHVFIAPPNSDSSPSGHAGTARHEGVACESVLSSGLIVVVAILGYKDKIVLPLLDIWIVSSGVSCSMILSELIGVVDIPEEIPDFHTFT